MTDSDLMLVFTTLPDEAGAERLARELVAARLAACVSIQAPCRSCYRWQGKVEMATEIPLICKTSAARVADLTAQIRALHPYELPEIVTVRVADGLPAYLDWVTAETAPGGLRC